MKTPDIRIFILNHFRRMMLIAGVVLLAPLVSRAESTAPPPAETEAARVQRIGWWREARFGLFVHWGLYAIPGGVWKDDVQKRGYSEWLMYGKKIPAQEYAQLAGQFNPTKFDAAAWATIAKQAGMKYLVFTTKHHDGFSMFDSGLTPYNVVAATPFKRDVTKELAEAFRAAGLHFGCYYSVDRDWYRPQGPGNRYKQANVWDFPESKREDFDGYYETFARPQVVELLTKYRPDLLWFDEIDMKTDAQVEELYQTIRKLRPECVINSRIKGCVPPKTLPPPFCDYLSTGDNEIAAKTLGFEWENPGSMNTSYGYNPNDHNWASAAEIISRLVEIVSKGGNYLLNVGPTPEGLIPQPCIERLATVGEWMAVNGEAIYGTSASVFTHATNAPAAKWRSTTKQGKIYLHLFDWPSSGKFEVPGLQSKVIRAYPLAGRKKLKFVQTATGVTLRLPTQAPDKTASVICLEIADTVAKVAYPK